VVFLHWFLSCGTFLIFKNGPNNLRTFSAALTVERADAESQAWELTRDSRAMVKKLVGVP
jgi:hypothetical protein